MCKIKKLHLSKLRRWRKTWILLQFILNKIFEIAKNDLNALKMQLWTQIGETTSLGEMELLKTLPKDVVI